VIRLGINVPNFGPESDPASLLEWAQFAEQSGFETLVVSDHVAPTREITDVYPAPFWDPFVLLSWLAGQTRTLTFGVSVLVLPLRHPLLTARMSAAVHVLSGGRFVLGVGSGSSASEFGAVALDVSERGRLTDEYLEVILKAFANDRISWDAPGLRFQDVSTQPRPVGGCLPVWVGGASPPAIRRAARCGDAWHPVNPKLEWLRDAGLPALARAAAAGGRATPRLVPRIKMRVRDEPAPLGRPLGVGTVEQIVDDLVALADIGAVEIILDPNPDRPRPRDFATERACLLDVRDGFRRR
jgi:probable F420-dependent oxidoreductase